MRRRRLGCGSGPRLRVGGSVPLGGHRKIEPLESEAAFLVDESTIRRLLGDLESDRVERTVALSDTDKFGEAICAFSNDFAQNRKPGYLILGARDKTGEVAGAVVTDQLLQNLAGIRSDGNIQPLPAMSVQKMSLPEGDLAVVEVHPSDLPPVRYKGRVWIRVGPRRAIASEQEERLLSERRVSLARTFDALPCPEASLTDLSARLFEFYREEAIAEEVIAENHRTLPQQMASLRLFDAQANVPTHAGVLLFGIRPRYFLSGAYIQFLHFPSRDGTEIPADQAEIAGDLRSVLEEILLRVKVLNTKQLRWVSELQEETVSKYPEVALREILVNAVVHRNYQSTNPIRVSAFADRIEIASPGGLYGEVNRANFGSESSYRNPVLAEALKVMGFVNRFGYGIRRAERALKENGNPPLEVAIRDSSVTVTVFGLDLGSR